MLDPHRVIAGLRTAVRRRSSRYRVNMRKILRFRKTARDARTTPAPVAGAWTQCASVDRDAEAPLGLADDVVLAVARGVLVADEHDHAVGRERRERVLEREQRLALAGLRAGPAPSAPSAAAVCSAADSASSIASSLSDTQNATADSLTAGETTRTSAPSRSSSGRAARTRSASTGSVARTRSFTRRALPRFGRHLGALRGWPSPRSPVDVFADLTCPWCYIGHHRLGEPIAAEPGRRVVVRPRAFELSPELPAEGLTIEDAYPRRFDTIEALRDELERSTDEGARSGLELRHDRITRIPNTRLAHRAVALATRAGTAARR